MAKKSKKNGKAVAGKAVAKKNGHSDLTFFGWRRKNGRIDRLRGTKNEYAWVVLLNEGYSRSYSLGYRHGWTRPDEGPL